VHMGSGVQHSSPTQLMEVVKQIVHRYGGKLANTYASCTAVVLECSLLSIIFRAYTLPGMGASGWVHL
jgi:hypothetical protein